MWGGLSGVRQITEGLILMRNQALARKPVASHMQLQLEDRLLWVNGKAGHAAMRDDVV